MSRVENAIENLLNKVPGYKGYADKESRRDEDKRIRDAVSDALMANVYTLTSFNAELARQRDFEGLAALEAAVGQIRLLADRVRTASYGYGGIFTDTSVDANAIEQLRLFDAAMLRETDFLTREIGKVTAGTPVNNDARSAMVEEISRLTRLFDSRNQVVNQGRASQDAETLQLLALPEHVEASPLLQVNNGDALSVLGDNFIANAVITLKTSDGTITLIRVSADQEGATWLLGSDVSGLNSARLTELPSTDSGYQTMSSATATVVTEQGTDDEVAARYAYRNLGDNRVEFSLAIGDTINQYEGTSIVDNDIDVYGGA